MLYCGDVGELCRSFWPSGCEMCEEMAGDDARRTCGFLSVNEGLSNLVCPALRDADSIRRHRLSEAMADSDGDGYGDSLVC